MRNDAHHHPDAFDSAAANRLELVSSDSTTGLPGIRLDDPTSNDLSIIAARLYFYDLMRRCLMRLPTLKESANPTTGPGRSAARRATLSSRTG